MTFQTSRNKYLKSNQPEAGVTLMLAVLILSAITAIVFSLATIVIIEIRTAGDNLRTEPALYATLGVTEMALMQYRRNVPASQNSCSTSCTINNVQMVAQKLSVDNPRRVQTIRPNEKVVVPLFLPQQFDKQYGKIDFTVLETQTGGVIDITIREITVDNVVNIVYDKQLSESVGRTNGSFQGFGSNAQYELILDNTATGRKSVTVIIETYAPDGTTPKGIPFTDQTVLKVIATYLGLTRTYSVKIPSF